MLLLDPAKQMSGLPPIGYHYEGSLKRSARIEKRSIKSKTSNKTVPINEHASHKKPTTEQKLSTDLEIEPPLSNAPITAVSFKSVKHTESERSLRTKKIVNQSAHLPKRYQRQDLPETSNATSNYIEEKISDVGENTIDLLALSSFHSEYRQQIFGSEWKDKEERRRTNKKSSVGSTGINKPRRLEPIEGKTSVENSTKNSFPGRFPASTGLHLSVNFTSSLADDINNAFGPKSRRQNSLEEIKMIKSKEPVSNRPNSSPGNRNNNVRRETVHENDITPARANTPTDLYTSNHFSKQQIIGLSLATNSPEESINYQKKTSFSYAQVLSGNPDQSRSVTKIGVGRPLEKSGTSVSLNKFLPLTNRVKKA